MSKSGLSKVDPFPLARAFRRGTGRQFSSHNFRSQVLLPLPASFTFLHFTTMSVTYKEAMEQLSTMFPTIERSVINMILQQTRGHMERTIETLLELAQATEAPSKKTNGADDWGITAIKSTKSTTPTVREPKGSQKKQAESTRTNRRGSDGEKKDGSVLRDETESKVDDDSEVFVTMTSTEDFLRPPSYFQQQLLSRALLKEHEEAWAVLQSTLMAAGKHELVQYLVDEAAALKQAQLKQQEIAKQLREDAMLAELIQNEWLVEELARRGMGGPTRRNQPKRFIEMPQIRENYMIAAGGEGSSVEADVKGKGKERGNVMEQKDNRDGRNVDHDRNPETLSVPQQSMLDTFLSSFEGLGSAAREKVSKLIDKLSGSKELQKDPQGPGPKYIELSNFGDTIDDYDGGNNDGRSAGQDNRMLLVNDEDHTEVCVFLHATCASQLFICFFLYLLFTDRRKRVLLVGEHK